jgi:hypothetical protein
VLGRARQATLVVGLADDPVQGERGKRAAFLEEFVGAELWRHPSGPLGVIAGVFVVKAHG